MSISNVVSLIVACLVLISSACKTDHRKLQVPNSNYNTEVIDSVEQLILVGLVTREKLQTEPYGQWYESGYSGYALDTLSLDSVKQFTKDISVSIFLATWCDDSQYEVPAFLKILDYLDVDSEQLTMISLDREKKSIGGETENTLQSHLFERYSILSVIDDLCFAISISVVMKIIRS